MIPAILSRVPDAAPDEAVAGALAAIQRRHDSPAESLEAARRIAEDVDSSPVARLVALWAQGLAERELNRFAEAETHLREAIAIGDEIDDPVRVAQVTSALVYVVAYRGRPEEALALAESVGDALPASERGDLELRRALALEQLGNPAAAVEAYSAALELIVAGDDRVLEARARCNRSVALAYLGRIAEALSDASVAERLAIEHGQYFLAGGAAHNQGFTAGLQGDIPSALASFARADALYARVGYPGRSAGVLASDRCEVMLAAGLHDEALANAETAVRSLEDVDDVIDLAEARLLLARAHLAVGAAVDAHRVATTAEAEFRASGRPGWATLAEFVALTAAQAASSLQEAEDLGRTDRIADDLDRRGWPAEAAAVRVSAAELALARGDVGPARRRLLAAAGARTTGRADRRANAWLATAYLREVDGDVRGAKRAAAAGLRVLRDHQATLGATDLRVGASTHAGRLAQFGLRLAVEGGRPRDILTWAERVRANALAVPSVRPPSDSPLASALVELRRQRSALDDARRAGEPTDAVDLAVRHQERAVRDLARLVEGGAAASELSIATLQARLGAECQLVEYVDVDGMLLAVIVTDARCRTIPLASTREVASAIDQAVFSASRLARSGSSEASRAASRAGMSESLGELERLLVTPLRLDGGDVVIVPTGVLHDVPWGGLPSLSSQSHVVAASATRWRPDTGLPDSARVAVVVGPRLADPTAEVEAVLTSRPTARRLTASAATVDAGLALLGDSDIAHLACHGHFRRDSPMFSSLAMADGPLTVYDLESLASPPALVVLPACNAGLAAVSVGDELIGTAGALLGVGVRHVVAPITVVNDLAVTEVMRVFHRHLPESPSAAAALARTRIEIEAGGDLDAWAASVSLLCLG